MEYASKVTTCSAASGWTDVGAVGGDWDMSDSTFIASDGLSTTDLTVANGGTTNENSTHLTPNGALRDSTSQTGSLTFGTANFLELEFAIEPTATAPQGTTYCFRYTDAGTALRNYDIYPEGTISADIVVSASGTQITSLDASTTDQYIGGLFVIERDGSARTVTDITINETGSIDGANDLSNIELYYEMDAGDCTGQTYDGGETQFGTTDSNGFSSANGSSTFSGSQSVSTGNTMCVYVVMDVEDSAQNGDTIEIEISNPSSDVIVTSSSVGPSATEALAGSTNIDAAVLTQVHYHWRNDDGSETGASSASGGTENTSLNDISKEDQYRIRIGVSNEGNLDSNPTSYRLEYGAKVTTCDAIGIWTDVDTAGGAWDMALSSNISDGNTTNISGSGFGAITDENTTFVGTGALRETSSESGAISLTTTEFTELEYSIMTTLEASFGATYCFRVSDAGTAIAAYSVYPEVSVREKQDFFIQRGNTTVSGTGTVLTAGIDYTAPSATTSAFVRITNSQLTGAGIFTGNPNQNADDVTAYISDQSDITSSFTITRPDTATGDTRVSWEIVEFTGIANTDNEVIVRDVGELTLTATNFTATGTSVSTIDDNSSVAVFITGQMNEATGRDNYNDGLFTAEWNGSSSEPVVRRADADSSASVSYAVVEFTGLNWLVQRVEHTYTATGSAETESITAIPNVSKGFIHAQKRVGEGLSGLDEHGHQVWLSSLGAVSFQLRSGANTPSDHTSVAWVISNSQTGTGEMTVYQSNGTITQNGPAGTAVSFPIGGTIETTNASIFATNDSSGTGTAYPNVQNGYNIASSTNYEIWRSNTGQSMAFRVEVVEWPVAETSIRQNYYRFYVDNDEIDPVDPWPVGAPGVGENEAITSNDDPIGEGERVRIRMSLLINNASLPESSTAFKLQYGAQVTSCSAISAWNDVGAPGSGAIWRGYDATPIDGTELATSTPAAGRLNLSVSDVAGTYEEQNNTTLNPYAASIGEDIEYDWLIEHNAAAQRTNYCFRMVYTDGTEIDGYLNYPTLRTTGFTPVIGNWRWYDDETSQTPSTPLASENVAPTDIANQEIIKLRLVAEEVESAEGTNVKFALQFSEYADFSDGGTIVIASSSCQADSLWCYADGAGVDNAVIQSSVITGADSCVAGTGNGCGTHNEAPTTTSTHTQPADSNMEYEFTIRQAGARASGVYYFRLFDSAQNEPIVASGTFPSVVVEGPQLVFSVAGLDAGENIAGITTDATTTATAVSFGTLPFNSSVEAAQRITVDTSATEGYQVLKYARQQMTNTYGDELLAISTTNSAPSGWSTACSISANSCVGYHSTDASLQGGSSRFAPLDSYAALHTDALEIMYSSIPIVDVHDIIYRIEVRELQVAGLYETDIVYIAVPVF